MVGRSFTGLSNHSRSLSTRISFGTFPLYLRVTDGSMSSIFVFDPGQKYDAECCPCFSAVTQIGSPHHQRGSSTRMLSEIMNLLPKSHTLFSTMPWCSG